MPDYPSTAEEALAFSCYGWVVNCIFEVYQMQEELNITNAYEVKNPREVVLKEDES